MELPSLFPDAGADADRSYSNKGVVQWDGGRPTEWVRGRARTVRRVVVVFVVGNRFSWRQSKRESIGHDEVPKSRRMPSYMPNMMAALGTVRRR